MLIYSMSVSVDGFIADRAGAFGWTVPNEEQFRFHIAQTRELGGYLCGRRPYQTMLPWETRDRHRSGHRRISIRSTHALATDSTNTTKKPAANQYRPW